LVIILNDTEDTFVPIYIQQNATLHSLFYPETALHISGGISTHNQEIIHLYLQHQVFVISLLLSAAISWNRFECAVGGVRHPQHTQTSSNSSTTPAGSSNGVKKIPDVADTVVCAPDDGWWYHPKHVEQFPDINELCNVASCWIYTEYIYDARNHER